MFNLPLCDFWVGFFVSLLHTHFHNKNMKKNMGTADRTIRTIIAIVAAYLYFAGIVSGPLGIVLLVVAVIFLLTSLISFCPLYTLVGIKTCPSKR